MRLFLICVGVLALAVNANASTVFSGYDVAFSKAPFANPSLPANQDQMTANVAITRGNVQGIYNALIQSTFSGSGPLDTEWAFGTTAIFSTLTYQTWQTAVGSNPPGSLGRNMVVHLITDDIYIDLRFTAWGQGGSGGSFSYVRSTIPGPATMAILPIGATVVTRRRR